MPRWAPRLCFTEWDLEPASLDQVAHLLAVLIQGQVEGYKRESDANVRTPFSRTRLLDLVGEAGWMVSEEFRVDTGNLRDADWEIDHCLTSSLSEVATIDIPHRIKDLIASQGDIRGVLASNKVRPLPSYALVAVRRSLE